MSAKIRIRRKQIVNLKNIWMVAQAERLHTRRLVRYWVFLVVAFLLTFATYFYYSTIHAFLSSMSGTISMIGSRYLLGILGAYYLFGFIFGIVFLGFDLRARDVREKIVEVLDSRPVTNLELVAGRFLGLLLSCWIPAVAVVLLIQGAGWLLPLLGSPIGRTVQPVSIISVALPMALPAIAFSIAMVFFITLLVRNRLIAAVMSLAALAGLYWGMYTLPNVYSVYFDFMGAGQIGVPSDMAPFVLAEGGWLQRSGFLVIALGLVGLTAAIHPRLDGAKRVPQLAGSSAVFVAGILMLFLVSQQRLSGYEDLQNWRQAHETRASEPVVDIQSINGTIKIDPGEQIQAKLQVGVQAPVDSELNSILFTLNPGLVVASVTASDGTPLTFQQSDGLLEIILNRTLSAGESATINVDYTGEPDTNYGYLDSVLQLDMLNMNEQQVGLLGYLNGIFDSDAVVLTPGIRWLPASGVDVGRDDVRSRAVDYFTVDLNVEVPASWTVAGPGKRRELNRDNKWVSVRFAPPVPLPEVALAGAEFKSFSTEIDGITFEVLVHPDHDANFKALADSRNEVEQWIEEQLKIAEEAGLDYPFNAFTLVEVPNTLRGYEGGWRLDTAMAPPAMVMMHESGFPTARFDWDFRNSGFFGNARDYDSEGGIAKVNRDRLINFFSNDISGGNVFAGVARSFFVDRTSAIGPEALAINFMTEELATMLLSGRRSYFSAHLFTNINQAVADIISTAQGRGFMSGITDAVINANTSDPSIWDTVLSVPLTEVDPYKDPKSTLDILTLKGSGMSQAIFNTLGPEKTGKLLSYLLERHQGGSYNLSDLEEAGQSVDAELGNLFRDWFSTTQLPGFVAEDTELYRLPDNENGDTRYQVLIRVRNDEPVTGFARFSWALRPEAVAGPVRARGAGVAVSRIGGFDISNSDPVRIPGNSAIEFGVILSKPPFSAALNPYVSLNRDVFNTRIWGDDIEIPTRKVEPFSGVREVPWQPDNDNRIIADDLDEGFEVINNESGGGFRLIGITSNDETDQGLPVGIGGLPPAEWSRRAATNAWGRYRHTMAYIRRGDGNNRAIMPVNIPHPGEWELEIHVPFLPFLPPQDRGTWNLEVVTEDGREEVAYDATVGAFGWNLVGQYYLPAGEVRVEFTDKTEGRMVVADAIAWSPVGNQKAVMNLTTSDTDDAK